MMDWEDVAFLIGQAVDELLAKIDEGVVEHVTIGSQLLGKAHHARVGIKFGDAIAAVRLREPPRDRHRMRVPGWHRRLRNGASGDIEANQKCENALHSRSVSKTRQHNCPGGVTNVLGLISLEQILVVPAPTLTRYSHSNRCLHERSRLLCYSALLWRTLP